MSCAGPWPCLQRGLRLKPSSSTCCSGQHARIMRPGVTHDGQPYSIHRSLKAKATIPKLTEGSSAKMSAVPLPWCRSKSRIMT